VIKILQESDLCTVLTHFNGGLKILEETDVLMYIQCIKWIDVSWHFGI
jgi:hypothetical protein